MSGKVWITQLHLLVSLSQVRLVLLITRLLYRKLYKTQQKTCLITWKWLIFKLLLTQYSTWGRVTRLWSNNFMTRLQFDLVTRGLIFGSRQDPNLPTCVCVCVPVLRTCVTNSLTPYIVSYFLSMPKRIF